LKHTGSKRKREDYDDDEDDRDEDDEEDANSDDYNNERRSPTPEAFYLGSTQKPSPKSPTWNYRWRGQEQGECEIQLYSDEKAYQITLSGQGGTNLAGTFGGSFCEDCEFTGKKISMGGKAIDIGEEWEDHSERAYEGARVGRWN
jgi:hypothetical protein